MTLPLLIEAIAIGIVISVFFAEWFGLSASGLIVPGYLAYHLSEPVHIFIILLATFATLIAEGVIKQFMILFGRRLLAMDVLLSFVFVYLFEHLFLWIGLPVPLLMDTIGYFIPALVVIFIGSNGLGNTLLSIVIITIIVKSILLLFCI